MIAIYIVCAVVLLFGMVVFRGAPYVPSHPRQVKRAFDDLYSLSSHDTLVDVGSGDGIILRMAARHGARAIGYELNPILVAVSRWLGRRYEDTETRLADFWLVELPEETTIVYAFAVSRDTKKLTRKLQREANRLGRPLMAMTYGAPLHTDVVRELGAHHLYRFVPQKAAKKTLQGERA